MNDLLGEIAAIYEKPLTEKSSLSITYLGKSEKLDEIYSRLNAIIKRKREQPEFSGNPLTFSPERSNALRTAIKTDKNWIAAYKELVNALHPEIDFEKMANKLIESINIPWWASKTLALVKDTYDGDSLDIAAKVSHSYAVQLMRNGMVDNKESTLSITGIITTSDGKAVLGERGGHSLKGAIMTVPAGYVDYPESIFDSFYRECKEEIGLKKSKETESDESQIYSAELIGREISFGRENNHESNTLYIFKAKTPLRYDAVVKVWESAAADRGEHRKLIGVENNPEAILQYIKDGSNKVIPPGAASLLTYCCHEDQSIITRAKQLFENQYKFSV